IMNPSFRLADGSVAATVHIYPAGETNWLTLSVLPDRKLLIVDMEDQEPVKGAYAWLASFEEPPFVERPTWISLPGSAIRASAEGLLSANSFPLVNGGGGGFRVFFSCPR